MCVAIPGKVIEIKNKKAKVVQADHTHWLDTSLIDEEVKVGDYLLAYQEAAINKLTETDALKVIDLLQGEK